MMILFILSTILDCFSYIAYLLDLYEGINCFVLGWIIPQKETPIWCNYVLLFVSTLV